MLLGERPVQELIEGKVQGSSPCACGKKSKKECSGTAAENSDEVI